MKWLTAILLTAVLATSAGAQQPRIENARLETRSAAAGLQQALGAIEREQPGAAWVGYAVPVIAGEHDMCCFNSYADYRRDSQCCGGCRLEAHSDGMVMGEVSECGHLEPAQGFFVLLRVEQGQVEKVRAFSANCALDAGGLPLYWLTGVKPAESVALLASLMEKGDRHLVDQAMAALAMHADPGAQAALIRVARGHGSSELRGQALFWLAQQAGDKVAGVITETIERDPDTQLKKKAVFALSEMPPDQGVPLLIGLVNNNRNPVVRKEAMFWLGQSDDPRAMDFIISILER